MKIECSGAHVAAPLRMATSCRRLTCFITTGLLAAGPAPLALAQASAEAERTVANMLNPIVVEGEKLPRDLLDTFSSVDVITGDELQNYNMDTLGQALNNSANVRSFETGTGNSSFTIRGLNAEGVTQPTRSSPVISVKVDGAEQGIETTRRGTRGIWDVDQVEVLRGPQSTLQGRDSLGGAIIVETADPTFEPELKYELAGGEKDYQSAAFAVSGPVVEDEIAVRVAGQVFGREKDIRYTSRDNDFLKEDEFEQIRAKVLFAPSAAPDFDALLTYERTHDRPAWGLISGPDYFERVYDNASQASPERRDTYVDRYLAELGYDIGDHWRLESVTAFVDTDLDISSSPGAAFPRDDLRSGEDLSQDVRLTFDAPDAPVSGVVGLFAGRFTQGQSGSIQTELFGPLLDVQRLDSAFETQSIAAYFDARYAFVDRWSLIAGGRLLRDEVSARLDGRVLNFANPIDPATGAPNYSPLNEDTSVTNTEFLPKAGIAHELTPNQNVALTASRGYRAGFSEVPAGFTQVNEVEPESLWAYELAYRSRWLAGRLDFNANLFYYDYSDQQIPVLLDDFPGQSVTANAGESRSYGVEFDTRWLATPELEVFTSLGVLDTKFKDGTLNDGTVLDGNEFPESPSVTATVGAHWRHASGFFAAGDVSYTDDFYTSGVLDNDDASELDSFTVVNARVGYTVSPALTVSLFAKNLLGEDYLTSIQPANELATVGDARRIGVQLEGRF
ncbi:TonB-dependent receptor [Endozoicomonas sp. G2_2]|uniref:TonB-dependent receptor n=1 Tax=Endozoicomonas sp. G2_2 TaxID=2821092 RepID=UPI001ADBC4DB|nr:TonB-dependent receptor [Endozoicomonas sp. G2_2]MBO9470760.1 TonB-dependent receptor [Endozoicomonas sp. G2_2]